MKRLVLILIVVFTAGTLLAGEGKSCDVNKKASAKTVELTGTLEDGGKIFRVANSNQSYTVCHKSVSDAARLGAGGASISIKGKVVACDEADGEELVIVSAKKV